MPSRMGRFPGLEPARSARQATDRRLPPRKPGLAPCRRRQSTEIMVRGAASPCREDRTFPSLGNANACRAAFNGMTSGHVRSAPASPRGTDHFPVPARDVGDDGSPDIGTDCPLAQGSAGTLRSVRQQNGWHRSGLIRDA